MKCKIFPSILSAIFFGASGLFHHIQAQPVSILPDRIGIGTATPYTLLDVRGDISFSNNALISHAADNDLNSTNIDHIWHDDLSGANIWHFVSDGSYKDIGNSQLEAGQIRMNGEGTNYLLGNVGIGTVSPTEKLTVFGNTRIIPEDNSGRDPSPELSVLFGRDLSLTVSDVGNFEEYRHNLKVLPIADNLTADAISSFLGDETRPWDYVYADQVQSNFLITRQAFLNYNSTPGNVHLRLRESENSYARMRFDNTNSTSTTHYWAVEGSPNTIDARWIVSYDDGPNYFNILTARVANGTQQVGINDNTPDFTLDVEGTAGKPGGGDWSNASDRRLKKDIEDFEDGLEQVLKIRPVWYRYNGKFGFPTTERYVGVIAQEIQEVAPYMVTPYRETDEKTGEQGEYLSYNGTAVTYMLVNAVKEQQTIIEEKEARIAELETKIKKVEDLEARLANLEALLPPTTTIDGSANANIVLQQGEDRPHLDQNAPNPFDGTTTIGYYLPEGITHAFLRFADPQGRILKTVMLEGAGKGRVNLTAGELPGGTYSYSLIVDGRLIATRQMVLTK